MNPTYALTPTFETVIHGLDDGVTLTGLWLCRNQLWSIDTTNSKLLSYEDTLTVPVTLVSPPNKATDIGTITNDTINDARLDWEVLNGATRYQWQLDRDTDFSSLPSGFEDDTKASSTRLPTLEPATRHYWRVRVTEPVLSPWSDKWSFTTSIGNEFTAPELYTPEAGANSVPIRPVFQWSAIAEADSYELELATDINSTSPIISENTLPTNT